MPGRRDRALINDMQTSPRWKRRALTGLAFVFLALPIILNHSCTAQSTAPAGPDHPRLEHLGTYVWWMKDPDFGGYSDIRISDGGSRFIALSDRASLRWGRLHRDAAGRIDQVQSEGYARLKDSEGNPLLPGWKGDSEGMAIGPDDRIWISFEGLTRVVRHDRPEAPAKLLPRPEAFHQMQLNSSLESLAILPDGSLLAIPERSGARRTPFPVWRLRHDAWDQPFSIPRRGDFLVVEADIGPDGRLYILERDFMGLLGFRSRIRRFTLTAEGIGTEQTLLTTRPLQYDNLEGMSVWQDAQGLRLTLISDDNYLRLQRTELVEYRLIE